MFDEPAQVAMQCFGLVVMLLDLAIAITALVKLKTTRAGIVLALGFGLSGILGLVMRIFRYLTPEMAMHMDDPMFYFTGMAVVQACMAFFYMTIIAVGVALIPSSLKKLAGERDDRPREPAV